MFSMFGIQAFEGLLNEKNKLCLFNSRLPADIFTAATVMCHFEVHNNEQSRSITVLNVPHCLLNQLSQLLFALCLLCISFVRMCAFGYV